MRIENKLKFVNLSIGLSPKVKKITSPQVKQIDLSLPVITDNIRALLIATPCWRHV
jgi:hypothetical protein